MKLPKFWEQKSKTKWCRADRLYVEKVGKDFRGYHISIENRGEIGKFKTLASAIKGVDKWAWSNWCAACGGFHTLMHGCFSYEESHPGR
jgi:hypothetical protein